MVLYIFHVNSGTMLTFDMEMALQTVQNLKETIDRLYSIPSTKQVLMISGGEVLNPMSRVCSYPSGTDENPIYMFCTYFDSSKLTQPWPSECRIKYEDEVSKCLKMPAEYNTVVIRAKLAQKMYDSATKEIKECERHVFDQHLQQQGWAAVMANLEDLTNEFKQRSQMILNTINDYLEKRPKYLDLLNSFPADLVELSTVPILSELLPCAQHDFHGFDEIFHDTVSYTGSTSADSGTSVGGSSSNSRNRESLSGCDSGGVGDSSSQTQGQIDTVISTDKTSAAAAAAATTTTTIQDKTSVDSHNNEAPKSRTLTLLQWISSKENHKALDEMAKHCGKVLTKFDENSIQKVKEGIKRTIDIAEQESVREVGGLTKRLELLDTTMCEARKLVQDQKELSTAFQQNQTRANHLGDASILPDLCLSHSNQLSVMLLNHNKLLDFEKRIFKAKEELAENLNKRLDYVAKIENSISDLDCNLLLHHENFKRLKNHMMIIEQIHEAPTTYVTAVTEIVRRKLFSDAMLKWAAELSSNMFVIHDEERSRREEFENTFDQHFLNALFLGLEDEPPTFATQAPAIFDNRLPNLTKADLQYLKEAIPDIASKIELPDLKFALDFFSTRYGSSKDSLMDKKSTDDVKLIANKLLDIRTFKDGCESETDTEEFEKVGQSPIDRRKLADGRSETVSKPESVEMATSTNQVETVSIETLTEDNAGTAQIEIERLKTLLVAMAQISRNSIELLRKQLVELRDGVNCDKNDVAVEFKKIETMWSNLKEGTETNEREIINRLTVDHELELTDVRKLLTMKTDEVVDLKAENSKLLEKLANSELETETSKTRSSNEIDALKARIAQLEDRVKGHETEKTKAVNEIKDRLIREHKTEIESLRCRYKLMKNVDRTPSDTSLERVERPELQACSPTSSQSLYRRILDEKERQLDAANSQVDVLSKQNDELKRTIQNLTEGETLESVDQMKIQIDTLQKEKYKLRQKLHYERSKNIDLVPAGASTSDPASSTLTKSLYRARLCTKHCISVSLCEVGVNVLIIFNEQLSRFVIVQDSPIIHFLEEDSHTFFNLPVPTRNEEKFENVQKAPYYIGVVTEKQFCLVKREGTRYRVPIGTRFYRIKVRPLPPNSRTSSISENEQGTQSARKSSVSESIAPSSSQDTVAAAAAALSTSKITTDFCRPNPPVVRSLSAQFTDSFAQTESTDVAITETTEIPKIVEKDMVDSGVVDKGERISPSGSVSTSFVGRLRYASVGEDEAIIVDNVDNVPSSQEETATNLIEITDEFGTDGDQDESDEYRSLDARSDDVEPIS
ncbi:RB1-inducible coiled-coil protein 1 isoform X2 [Contarinia nasturtii]|uniref:RB1-inducible coiled-coil protein 1 isoform X2 n=1 Tax=Contarinia nasturtii TaxID=265458 RepID=UPI0012D39E51|nr:RB1-inducible coiled-coil protein 1 isoform X2 [Contarinia nasturtii]